MSNIEKFNQFKNELNNAKRWQAMFGKPYSGGGGGVGRIASAEIAKIEIYYQESNGSKNYHGIPSDSARKYISEAAKVLGHQIINKAIELMHEELKALAEQAKSEAIEVLELTSNQTGNP